MEGTRSGTGLGTSCAMEGEVVMEEPEYIHILIIVCYMLSYLINEPARRLLYYTTISNRLSR